MDVYRKELEFNVLQKKALASMKRAMSKCQKLGVRFWTTGDYSLAAVTEMTNELCDNYLDDGIYVKPYADMYIVGELTVKSGIQAPLFPDDIEIID